MYPILFEVPGLGFPIRSFGVMFAAGFLVGSHLLQRLAQRYGDDPEEDPISYSRITVWMLIGILIGARIMYVIVEIARGSATGKAFLDEPFRMLAVWEGGLVMYGGLFGAMAGGMWCARRSGVRILHALDLGLIAGFVGLAIGRIGCLLVGDDYGRVVPESLAHLPFPITITVPEELAEGSLFGSQNAGKVLYATQVWMMLNALAISAFAWFLFKRRRYTGQVALWVIFVYAVTRSVIEHFRGDSVRGEWFGGALSTSQIVSIAAGGVALVLLVKNRGHTDPALATPTPSSAAPVGDAKRAPAPR